MQTLNSSSIKKFLERLERLGPETPARWGKMSAHQMVCHLNDSFDLAMGEKTASEDVTLLNRTLIKCFALYAPFPWPKGVPTRPEMDQLVGGTHPVEFLQDKAALAAGIERFARHPATAQSSRHPIFGKLTGWEWIRWGYLHADHHFRQFGL